jgi:superfamily II DNA or RNA helicase
VVVHKEFLMHQWHERISQFLPDARVGRIQCDTFDYEGRDIVLCMLQTLALRSEIPAAALRGYGLVIVDECHHASAQVFSRALRRQEFPRSMGLSATIDRKDGLGYVFQWLIGPVVFRSKASSAGLEPSARIAVFRPPPASAAYSAPGGGYGQEIIFNGRVALARMLTALCGSRDRTGAIASALKALREQRPGCRILVLSERRTHLSDIRDALAHSDPDADSAFYVGGMRHESLKAAELAGVILGTFSMAAEGMDIPALDTLVLATPKSDIEQAVGRIMRAKALHPPLVLDIVDDFSVFAAQARRRLAFYRKRAFTIEHAPDVSAY